jgi:iron complex transport system ATP-binding protein
MTPKTDPLLQLQGIDFAFGDKILLQDFKAQVQTQDFIGLLGPNGCGKTTLIKLLSGVLRPNGGQILLKGKALQQWSRRNIARTLAVLPQETQLDFPFTAQEVVLMGRSPYLGTFQWEQKEDLNIVREAMEQCDCWDYATQDIRELSGGERERVFLARALAQQPEILLLDEPTTHLDLKHQRDTLRLLQRCQRELGLSILMVLHDINFAMQACEKVWVMGSKGLAGEGPPETTLTPELIAEVFSVKVNRVDLSSGRPWIHPDFLA